MTTSTHDIDDLMNSMIENLKTEARYWEKNGSYDLSYTTQLNDCLFFNEEEDSYILVTSFDNTFDQIGRYDHEEGEEPEDWENEEFFADYLREDNDIPSTHSEFRVVPRLIQRDHRGYSRDLYSLYGVGVVHFTR